MTNRITPRGRLPQRVYWFRRSMLLLVALALVFGIGHLLGGGSSDPAPQARQTGATTKSTTTPTVAPTPTRTGKPAKVKKPKVVLAQPDGPCLPSEVTVTPASTPEQAGKAVPLALTLSTTRPACTFSVSSQSVVVKITSGADRIWSSQDCPKSIPASNVVVRAAAAVTVPVSWSGRRSDAGCTTSTGWADIGYYHAAAATLGGQATDVQFRLIAPKRPVVIKTIKPKPHPTTTPTGTAKPKTGGTSGKGTKCGGDNSAKSC